MADNGRVAYELLMKALQVEHEFDLLISDMQMPEMDGYTLAFRLREEGYKGPIIALTAHAMAEDRDLCLKAGCNAYITKPIVKDRLLSECAKWLTQPREIPGLHAQTPSPR